MICFTLLLFLYFSINLEDLLIKYSYLFFELTEINNYQLRNELLKSDLSKFTFKKVVLFINFLPFLKNA